MWRTYLFETGSSSVTEVGGVRRRQGRDFDCTWGIVGYNPEENQMRRHRGNGSQR